MYSNDQLSELIGLIYEGASDPASFHLAMRRFKEMSNAHFVFSAVIDGASASVPDTMVMGPETSQIADASRRMQTDMVAIDPGLPFALARPEGGVFKLADATSELTPELDTWRDFIRHGCGSSDYHSRFGAQKNSISVVLALHADGAGPGISADQEALHSIVFDHFERAARLAYRPPKLSEQHTAAIMVDAHRNIIDANAAADALLSRTEGLIVRGGKLYAVHLSTDRILAAAFAAGCSPQLNEVPGPIVIEALGQHPPIMITFQPIPLRSLRIDNPSFLCRVEFRGGELQSAISPEVLQLVFGLTPREAEVASFLTERYPDLPATASALGMGYETAKSHLRSACAKCGVSNQVELVRLLSKYRQ